MHDRPRRYELGRIEYLLCVLYVRPEATQPAVRVVAVRLYGTQIGPSRAVHSIHGVYSVCVRGPESHRTYHRTIAAGAVRTQSVRLCDEYDCTARRELQLYEYSCTVQARFNSSARSQWSEFC
eukprot:COSAG01_NODE_498_length_16259_cov_11.917512_18_plen_123_part_00